MSRNTSKPISERSGAQNPKQTKHVTHIFDITISVPPAATYRRTDILILAPISKQDRSRAHRAPTLEDLVAVLDHWGKQAPDRYDDSVGQLDGDDEDWIFEWIIQRVGEEDIIDEDPNKFAPWATYHLYHTLIDYSPALRVHVWSVLLEHLLTHIYKRAYTTALVPNDVRVPVAGRHFFPIHCSNGTDTVITMNLAHIEPTTFCAQNKPVYLILYFLRHILGRPLLAKNLGIYFGPDVEPLPPGLDLFEDGYVEIILTYPEENSQRRLSARSWRPGDYVANEVDDSSEGETDSESEGSESESTEWSGYKPDTEGEGQRITEDEESTLEETKRLEGYDKSAEEESTSGLDSGRESFDATSGEESTSEGSTSEENSNREGLDATEEEVSTWEEDSEREDNDTTEAEDSPWDENCRSDSDRMDLDRADLPS